MSHFRKVTGLLRTMEAEHADFERRTKDVMDELMDGGNGRDPQSLDVLFAAFAQVHGGAEKLLEPVVEEVALRFQ